MRLTAAPPRTVALVGNPNTGKSTLFNSLTGLRQRVANYPGVTVERREAPLKNTPAGPLLTDLPGAYSLSARSPDEAVVLDTLLGRIPGVPRPDLVIAVVDASNLERNLYLLSQVVETGLPVVVTLTMVDVAAARGIEIDVPALAARLGVPVVPVHAARGEGLGPLRERIETLPPPCTPPVPIPQPLRDGVRILRSAPGGTSECGDAELLRALVDEDGATPARLRRAGGEPFDETLRRARQAAEEAAGAGRPLSAVEAQARYAWIREISAACVRRHPRPGHEGSERMDAVLTHRVAGLAILLAVMAAGFQAIYAGAVPLMDGMEAAFAAAGSFLQTHLPPGALRSLAVDGILAGVGAVVVFLPQIAILFAFVAVLEDSGYMARAAFMMDRVLAFCGLSGRSFLPMLSSYACAVPGILATRTIEDRRDRFATILVAPLMSCSARLPVYVLLIAAFVPARDVAGGWLSLQGLLLFAMHGVGLAVAIPVAWILKATVLRGPRAPFLLEFPPYRWPRPRGVALRVWQEAREFLVRAGTLILATSVVVWAMAYFPRPAAIAEAHDAMRREAAGIADAGIREERLDRIDEDEAAAFLAQSALGRAGRAIEPAVRPLGWDWRIGMAAIASFPAREVVVAVLGTIFHFDGATGDDTESLTHALRRARRADGTPLFDLPVALSIMVFFALCAQCVSTLAAIRRETGAARWPVFAFVYMTILAYAGAAAAYQGSLALGWGGS